MKSARVLSCVLIGLIALGSLGIAQQAWALPGQDLLHQTVPTRTPRSNASATPRPTDTAVANPTPVRTAITGASTTPPATASLPSPVSPAPTATALQSGNTPVPATAAPGATASATPVPGTIATNPSPSATAAATLATLATAPVSSPATETATLAAGQSPPETPGTASSAAGGALQATLKADRFAIWEGQVVTISLQLTNTGGAQVQDVTVRLTWPAELALPTLAGSCLAIGEGTHEIRFQDLTPATHSECKLVSRVLPQVQHGKVLDLTGEARWRGGMVDIAKDQVGLPPAELPVTGGMRDEKRP